MLIREDIIVRTQDYFKNNGYRVTKTDLRIYWDAFVEVLSEAVMEDDVKIRNFGVFERKVCKPKKGRDLNTNTPVDIPARVRVSYRPSTRIEEFFKNTGV